ncbi:MAG: diaminopimelate epimerase [Bacteroidota bacterium]
MKVQFYKYHGAGNDFILIDNRENVIGPNPRLVEQLCNRRFGIGADGLMLLENSEKADFSMRYFNSDGYEASMCGNGGRCIASFVWEKGLISKETEFVASDGLHKAKILDKGIVALKMNDVENVRKIGEHYFLDTGSPHYVLFVDDINKSRVQEEGKRIRYDASVSKYGTNVDFVQIVDEDEITIRTYERGVENETLACGTGAVASAISTHLLKETDIFSFSVRGLGGKL